MNLQFRNSGRPRYETSGLPSAELCIGIIMSSLALTIASETPADAGLIEKLHERAFGPGRFARTASRMRETGSPDLSLAFVARVGSLLVGSIRQTPVKLADLNGLLLGPLTVEPAFEGKGIGRALMERSVGAAREQGYQLILLVGDVPYYARFGFKQVPMGRITLPGPVDPSRFLYLELGENILASISGKNIVVSQLSA